MASEEIVRQIPGFIRVYGDGTVERLLAFPFAPPSPDGDPQHNIRSKDVTISVNPKISARLFLPNSNSDPDTRLPILVYFHGGAFCVESAFSSLVHPYINRLVAEAGVVGVSVEYRLAPEVPLPAVYDDCWAALQWVASHMLPHDIPGGRDPWLAGREDFGRLYIGGDSSGANVAHNVAMRAGAEGLPCGARILGAFLSHPYFWGSEAIGRERMEGREEGFMAQVWKFVQPGAAVGADDPAINPGAPGAPSLAGLGCERVLVCVAERDELRERGVWYGELVRESGWRGELEVFESEGEEHSFHALRPETESAKKMMSRLASFLR